MPNEMDLPTTDDGHVYLAGSRKNLGEYVLAVTDSEGRESEVKLLPVDLLRLIHASSRLLAEAA
ncbi:hypothetical protein M2302_002256 [Micromonospora sp. A200]|uniref:hypothetical protein n=1 Tax=Micromonospora sp. A200 TaxID=2940568 RepID=UPI0024762452|nr:hypothetical protein [Micromonospora sp. A200]MDH6462081.1 hypothetical protein [Micromonospora sp. A200]